MIPHWQFLHDGWIEDMSFELQQLEELRLLLRKHPDDKIGEISRDMIKQLRKRMESMKREYEKIYMGKMEV